MKTKRYELPTDRRLANLITNRLAHLPPAPPVPPVYVMWCEPKRETGVPPVEAVAETEQARCLSHAPDHGWSLEEAAARYELKRALARIEELEKTLKDRVDRDWREWEMEKEGVIREGGAMPPVAKPKLKGVFTTGWSMVGYWLNLPKEES